jgi:hypothetical protein
MLWNRIFTPFISVFNNYQRALNWAGMLEQSGIEDIDIVVIGTYDVPPGQLWNAHQLAVRLGFPQWLIDFHENEYLFHGSIEHERVLAVLPAEGRRVSIPVHLGSLTLPQSFVNTVGSEDEEVITTGISREVFIHCDTWDRVRCEQTLHALCTTSGCPS